MTIYYEISFHSYWHCGSGQGAGASLDSLVTKDPNGMPYVPGKTLKGLIREAVVELTGWENSAEGDFEPSAELLKVFGYFSDNKDDMYKADSFFSNATLPHGEYWQIIKDKNQRYLYQTIASTAIEDEGVARQGSLRTAEVCVPCTLYAMITNVPESFAETISLALSYIKNLGRGRTRGLGRCTIKAIPAEQGKGLSL